MKKIIINEKSEVNAEGVHLTGCSKPVICVDNGKIFASGKDAATYANVTPGQMCECLQGKVKSCKGKHFCYLSKVIENLETLMQRMRELETMEPDAKKWRASQEAARQAEEERLATIRKAEEKKTAADAEVEKYYQEYLVAVGRLEMARNNANAAQEELDALNEEATA